MFFTPLQGNADLLIARLVQVLQEDGIKVVWDYPEEIGSQGTSYGGLIKVRPDIPSINKFITLAHEGAHEWLHQGKDTKGLSMNQIECQAEVSSYMIASHFGIQSPLAADYLRMYGNDKDTLKAQLGITKPLVHNVIDRMEEGFNLQAEFQFNQSKADATRRQYTRGGKHNKRKGR